MNAVASSSPYPLPTVASSTTSEDQLNASVSCGAAARRPKVRNHAARSPARAHFLNEHSQQLEEARICIVDDEEINIEVVQGYLEAEGYRNFFRATDPAAALHMLQQSKPDVVLLDVMMPNISGLEILAAMRADQDLCLVPVIVLTAANDEETKMRALGLGPSEFLAKPVNPAELRLRLKSMLTVKAYQDHLANQSNELEARVRERTKELAESRQRIIHCLARAAEYRDNDTGQHVIRVGQYAAIIAHELGFGAKQVELIEQAAQLHDIGKIGVPDAILLKDGKLDPEEFEYVKQHCSVGNSIIGPMSCAEFESYQKHSQIGAKLLDADGYPVLEMAGIIAQTHHERWDGGGYPIGLAGEDIPIEGRITAVADVFDALSSKRPYKPAFPREKCFAILEEGRGTHFDPQVIDAFFACSSKIVDIQLRYADA